MKELTGQEVLACGDSGTPVEVYIPEWEGSIYVHRMAGYQRDDWDMKTSEMWKRGATAMRNSRALLALYACCDKDGKDLFGPMDLLRLAGKCASALDRIFTVACRVNGIGQEEVAQLEKNSVSGTGEGSGST